MLRKYLWTGTSNYAWIIKRKGLSDAADENVDSAFGRQAQVSVLNLRYSKSIEGAIIIEVAWRQQRFWPHPPSLLHPALGRNFIRILIIIMIGPGTARDSHPPSVRC